ncbi:hypothetical protein BJV74DRAFT_799232 [Russula compacta]|nr:hypothetical protein BJV74DRAFT_799232 [Russula compacta]
MNLSVRLLLSPFPRALALQLRSTPRWNSFPCCIHRLPLSFRRVRLTFVGQWSTGISGDREFGDKLFLLRSVKAAGNTWRELGAEQPQRDVQSLYRFRPGRTGQNAVIMTKVDITQDWNLAHILAKTPVVCLQSPGCHCARARLVTFTRISKGTRQHSIIPPSITSSLRGYFYADAKDCISKLEGEAETAELYAPVRTFLAYMAAHLAPSCDPVVRVAWEAWCPHPAHLTYPITKVHSVFITVNLGDS